MPTKTVPRSEADALVEAGGRVLEHRLGKDGKPVCVVEDPQGPRIISHKATFDADLGKYIHEPAELAEEAGDEEGKPKNTPKSSKKSQPEVESASEE